MCPPSENIQKRHTDNLSARRPRLRANETSRRYTVNTGSDDDVEAAVQEAVTSHDRSFALFLVVYAPSVRLVDLCGRSTWIYIYREIHDNSHLCSCSNRMRISEHVTRSMVCRYEFIRRVPFHLRGKKKSKKKGKIRIVGWVEAGRRRHRHRCSQPNCGWRGCWKTTQERTVRLGRLTLDIVFWILMAFTGVSDWTSASNSWRKLRVC